MIVVMTGETGGTTEMTETGTGDTVIVSGIQGIFETTGILETCLGMLEIFGIRETLETLGITGIHESRPEMLGALAMSYETTKLEPIAIDRLMMPAMKTVQPRSDVLHRRSVSNSCRLALLLLPTHRLDQTIQRKRDRRQEVYQTAQHRRLQERE